MIKYIAIIPLLFVLSACEEPHEKTKRETMTFQNTVNEYMIYAQDKRTGLCFAKLSAYIDTIANVPCTPEVMNRIRLER